MPIMSNVLTSIEVSDLGAGMTNKTGRELFWKTYYKKLVECGTERLEHVDCVWQRCIEISPLFYTINLPSHLNSLNLFRLLSKAHSPPPAPIEAEHP